MRENEHSNISILKEIAELLNEETEINSLSLLVLFILYLAILTSPFFTLAGVG